MRKSLLLAAILLLIAAADPALGHEGVFAYDSDAPLNAEMVELRGSALSVTYHVTFDSANGERVPALFVTPRGRRNLPTILFIHGLGMTKDLGAEAETMLAAYGYAVMMIDAQYVGERSVEGRNILYSDLEDSRQALVQTVIDNFRAVDWLMTRPEVDKDRIGVLGVSLGSFMGSVVFALDERLAMAGFGVGGANWRRMFEKTEIGIIRRFRESGVSLDELEELFGDLEPLNFVHRFEGRPRLYVNGRFDNIVPIETGIEFYEKSPEPKHIFLFDGRHVPSMTEIPQLVGKAIGFFQRYLTRSLAEKRVENNSPPQARDLQVEARDGFGPLREVTVRVRAHDPDDNLMMVKAFIECEYVEVLLNDQGRDGDETAGDGVYSGRTTITRHCEPGPTSIQVKAVDYNGASSETLVYEVEALEMARPAEAQPPVLSEFSVPERVVSGDELPISVRVTDPNDDVVRVEATIRELGFSILLQRSETDPELYESVFDMSEYIPAEEFTMVATARDATYLEAEPVEAEFEVVAE